MVNTECPVCGRVFASSKAIGGHVSRNPSCRLSPELARERERTLMRQWHRARGRRPIAPLAERFESKVDRRGPGECWPWLGTHTAAGYGQIFRDGMHRPATHVALELDGRPLQAGQVACHRCDNPPCVNPAHLFGGTHSDNANDKVAKGRDRWTRARAVA